MNKTPKSFFESVAAHNLERFHSECIAWCLDTFKDEFCIPFIEKITNYKNEDIKISEIQAEDNQCDIRIVFEIDGQEHIVFIENKIKSSESKKPITDKLLKNLPVHLKKKLAALEKISEERKKLSQTEYYYLREKYEYKQNNLFFVYLKPSVIPKEYGVNFKLVDDYIAEKKFNDWVVLTECGVENPWKTMTFYELSEIQQKIVSNNASLSENAILYNGYQNFIKSKFGKGVVDITNYKKNKDGNYGAYEFFRLVYESLTQRFEGEIEGILESSSAHGNEPLVEFFKDFKTPSEVKEYLKGGDLDYLRIGVQLQGDTLKFNIHAKDYDNVSKQDDCKQKYNDWCYKKLEELTKELEDKNIIGELRRNASKTKTGCSLSQKDKIKASSVDEFVEKLQEVISKFLKQE